MMTHTGEKPHKCPYCSHRSVFKSNITKHMVRRHGQTTAHKLRRRTLSHSATFSEHSTPSSGRNSLEQASNVLSDGNIMAVMNNLMSHNNLCNLSSTIGTCDSEYGLMMPPPAEQPPETGGADSELYLGGVVPDCVISEGSALPPDRAGADEDQGPHDLCHWNVAAEDQSETVPP